MEVQPIPAQIINERAAFGPFDLKPFFHLNNESNAHFSASLADGNPLPKGLICTGDGVLTGIPAKGSQGVYEFLVNVEFEGETAEAKLIFTIKPSLLTSNTEYLDQVKAQVWEALHNDLPLPDLGELYKHQLSTLDLYYLMERWGIITIWDAFNLEAPGDKIILDLPDSSEHYYIYDRGACLIGAPKDLYSHERTLEDGLKTARAMAREVYKRGWTVELVGFDKFVRGAWVELQHLSDKYNKKIEVINFNPTMDDVKIYHSEVVGLRNKLE